MSWLDYLRPWKRRERIEEEKKVEEMLRAQVKEAFLRQDDLREAAAQMKKAREEKQSERPGFREVLKSKPSTT